MDRLNINQLDHLVRSGLWRGDALMVAEIFQRYLFLIQRDGPFPNFGTPEYWDVFLGPDDDDQDGGAAVTRSAAAALLTPPPSPTFPVQPPPPAAGATFRMRETNRVYIRKFKTEGKYFELEFLSDRTPLNTVRDAFGQAIDRAFDNNQGNPLVGIDIRHPNLDRPIYLPFSTKEKLTVDNVMNLINAVLQSAAHVDIGSAMSIKVVTVHRDLVGGNKRGYRLLGKNASCLAQITNEDNMCLARSIVYAIARIEQNNDEETRQFWHRVRQGDKTRHTAQRDGARQLLREANVPIETKCGVVELRKIQDILPDYQIKAWDSHLNVFFEGPSSARRIYLFFNDDSHCQPIKSITNFLERNYFCEECNLGYDHREDHRCKNICRYCLQLGGYCIPAEWKKCDDCGRRFPSSVCFDNHKAVVAQSRIPTCQRVRVCAKCGGQYETRKTHHCGQQRCGSCKQYDNANDHQFRCFIQRVGDKEEDEVTDDDDEPGPSKKGPRPPKKIKSFIFFDLETRQDDVFSEGTFRHVPNYCVVQKACDGCKDQWDKDRVCANCGDRQLIFEGDNCAEELTNWLFQPRHKNCVVFAHNLGGFDGQFILDILTSKGLKPNVITRGLSILTMSVEGIRFLDSFAFLPMALAALPKAFGFDKDVLKGYFPHLFNTKENQNYIGPYPEAKYYCPNSMKPSGREKFFVWHKERQGKVFDFRKEIHDYCVDDTTILRRAALEFRDIFIHNTTVDPYLSSTTIASACSVVYRTLFLPERTIGIVPHEGYRRNDKQSVVAIQWLKWIAHSRAIDIQHAKNRGEKTIGPYKVDGFCHAENKIYEFHGCLFHGCLCIENRYKRIPGSKVNMNDAYNRTVERKEYFQRQGFQYEEIWNCEYDRQLKDNDEMADYIDSLDLDVPLDPRGAFFGGRTNATVLEKKAGPGEKIEYADFVSLYPTVLKNRPFPIGHPQILTENFEPIKADHNPYFGLIKCDVLPPRRLFHPVLPVRCAGKLMFPLCRTCAAVAQDECNHTENERMLKGQWVSVELDKALAMGYQIRKIYEVWTYDNVSDPTEENSLFGPYINCFLKLKAESSGYPLSVKTEEEKDAFVREFFLKEGVQLNKEKINKNSGLRMIAKLCLNSFWGKFGQRNNLPKCEYFNTTKDFSKLTHDPAVQINAIQFCGEETICVHYKLREAYVDALPNTNPVIAAFTTAWARLELYGCLEKLGRRVLYYDTDSVIYTIRDGEWRPTMGEKLGDMTDELAKDYGEGAYCDHFLGAGPKNYALSIVNGDKRDFVVKVRGINVNYNASQQINFESIRVLMTSFLTDGTVDTIRVNFPQITRTIDRAVLTREAHKVYRIVYSKRCVLRDGTTLPWGY